MTNPEIAASTTIHAPRIIAADPVRPKRARQSLRSRRSAAPLAVAAGILTAVNGLPLVLDRVQQPFAQGAAAMARSLATSWPAGGTGELLHGTTATAAALLATALLVLLVAGAPLPAAGSLVTGLAVAGLVAPAAWRLPELVSDHAWELLFPSLLSLVVLICGLAAALRWRSSGRGVAQPVRHLLVTWTAVTVLLSLGAGVGVQALDRASTATSTASAVTSGIAALDQRHSQDAAALAALRGQWVAQLASDRITDDAHADRYLAQHDQMSARFPAVLVRGDDFATSTLDDSYWLTLTRQTFSTEAAVAQWCTAQQLGRNACMPRLVATRS